MLCLWSASPVFSCWISVAPVEFLLLQPFGVGLAVEYSSCFISVLNLYVCCFIHDTLVSRCPSRGLTSLYVYEPQQNLGQGLFNREIGLTTPNDLLLTVPRWCFCCGLWAHLSRRLTRWAYSIPMVRRASSSSTLSNLNISKASWLILFKCYM